MTIKHRSLQFAYGNLIEPPFSDCIGAEWHSVIILYVTSILHLIFGSSDDLAHFTSRHWSFVNCLIQKLILIRCQKECDVIESKSTTGLACRTLYQIWIGWICYPAGLLVIYYSLCGTLRTYIYKTQWLQWQWLP